MEKSYNGPERRFYKRLIIQLPIKFSFVDIQVDLGIASFQQAFTADISGGGMAIELDQIEEELIPKLFAGLVRVGLKFEIPNNPSEIMSIAKAIWITKRSQPEAGQAKYLMGIQFIDITEKDRDKIIGFVVSSYLEEKK